MAKDVVMGMLREHLETWVEGIDKKQVDLQTFKGELSLFNLKLNNTEFEAKIEEKFGLQVHLIDGKIGELRASWSWTTLLTSPVFFEIRNLELRIEVLSSDDADRILRTSHVELDRPLGKSVAGIEKKTKGPMAFLKRAAGVAAAKVAKPKVDKLKRRITEQMTDRLHLTVVSIQLGFQLASSTVCGCICRRFKTIGLEPSEGEVQHQSLELEDCGFYVNELEKDHCERILDPNPPPNFILQPTSSSVEFVRTSGSRLNDIRGSELSIGVQDLDIAWSDEQFGALICGLTATRAWQGRIPRRGARGHEEEFDFREYAKDLCEDDAAKLLSSEAPLSDDAELVARVTLCRCRLLMGMEVGIPLARVEIDNSVELAFSVSDRQRRGSCIVKNLEILHNEERSTRDLQSLLIAPRRGGSPAIEVSFVQDLPEVPSISGVIFAAEVRMLPGWIRVSKTVRAGLDHLMFFSNQRERQTQPPRKPNLELKVQNSCYIFPAHYHNLGLLALRVSCEIGILSTAADDDRFISFQKCSTNFVQEGKSEHLFKDLTVNVSRKKARRCDALHALQLYFHQESGERPGIECDGCGKTTIKAPESVYRCHTCDFDLCNQCYSAPTKVHHDESYEVKVPPVMIAVTLSQFEGISLALSSARWMFDDCGDDFLTDREHSSLEQRSYHDADANLTNSKVLTDMCNVMDVKVHLHQFRICLVDSEGLASHLAATFDAVSVDAQWLFKEEEGIIRIGGFSIATISRIGQELVNLLERCDMELKLAVDTVWKCRHLFLRTSVYRLHVLKLFSHSLHRSLGQAGMLPSPRKGFGESAKTLYIEVDRVTLVLDDPDGFSGYLATSVKVNGLAAKRMTGRSSVCDVEFDYCNVQVCRSEDGYSDNNAAWLSLLRVSGNPSQRASVTFGSSISVSALVSVLPGPQMNDSSFGESASPAFRTENSQCYGSLDARRLKGKLAVGTFVLNTTDAFVKELAEILGQLNGGLRAVVQSMSMVFHGRRHGLKIKGCEVEKASGEALKGGFEAGSVILTVGDHQVMPEDDVQGLLKNGKLPLPVQFIKPQNQQEDLAVDLTLAPILIQVEYFKTANGRIVRDMTVQLGEVCLSGWKGSPSKLVGELSRRYVVELAKRMPWFSESIKAAASIVGSTAAKAFTTIHSKVASSISLGVGSLPDATELTLGLAETGLNRARQVGDFAVGVFSWWGLTGDCPFSSSPSASPNTGRAKNLHIKSAKAVPASSPKRLSTHSESRAAGRGHSAPPRKPPRKKKSKLETTLQEEGDCQEDVRPRSSKAPKGKRKPKAKVRSTSVPHASPKDEGAYMCINGSCERAPWNGRLGEACCRTCSKSDGLQHGTDCERKWQASRREVRTTTSTSSFQASSWAAPDAFFDENEYDAEVSEIVQTPHRSAWDTSDSE